MKEKRKDNIYLKNERLCVQIAFPGTYYKGSRFDWNGFITQVTLDGNNTFCIPESLIKGQGSGGCGLCGEFGIDRPIGYEDLGENEYFPKIGVGVVLKPDNLKYNFFRNYQFKPFKSKVTKLSNCVEFYVEPEDCNGYSVLYKKKISLNDNRVKIEHFLENVGTKRIHTTEYSHNFISIDGDTTGSHYNLIVPNLDSVDRLPEVMEYHEDGFFSWKDDDFQKDFYCILKGNSNQNGYSWDLYNSVRGVGIKEYDDFKPIKFALWGMKHVISPEIFIEIRLEPKETLRWTRCFEFYTRG